MPAYPTRTRTLITAVQAFPPSDGHFEFPPGIDFRCERIDRSQGEESRSLHHPIPTERIDPVWVGRDAERIRSVVSASLQRTHGASMLIIAHAPHQHHPGQREGRRDF